MAIADNQDDKALILYDVKSRVFLGHQLRIGQGPNEVIPPLSLGGSSETDALSVLQRRSGKRREKCMPLFKLLIMSLKNFRKWFPIHYTEII